LRGAVALLVGVSVLLSVVLGGHRYFYCAQMNEVSLDVCCQRPKAADDASRAVIEHECCAVEHFAPLSAGVHPRGNDRTLRAPLLFRLPVPRAVEVSKGPATCAGAPLARAGPRLLGAREHRLRLMVSLT
jgi:hypothetical protein